VQEECLLIGFIQSKNSQRGGGGDEQTLEEEEEECWRGKGDAGGGDRASVLCM
jgi:hypothetical protein